MNDLSVNNPIGFLDSGIGGINVLKAVNKELPSENLIYLGDNLNAPYGNKTEYELEKLFKKNVQTLINKKVKAIVIACSTLSVTVYEKLKNNYGIPIIPTLPPIAKGYKNPCLLSTPTTYKSDFVKENFKTVNKVPLPFLAGEVERFIFTPEKIKLKYDLTAIPENTDVIILGCTHYYFLKKEIERITGIKTLNANYSVVKNLKKQLTKLNLINTQKKGTVKFIGVCKEYNQKVYKSILKD